MTVSAVLVGGLLDGEIIQIANDVAADWSRSEVLRLEAPPLPAPHNHRGVCTYQRAVVDEDPLRYEHISTTFSASAAHHLP